ncbi:MAG: hypothetical protein ACJAUG_002599 [Halioglobus sp.]|jgi:hypothetical protein
MNWYEYIVQRSTLSAYSAVNQNLEAQILSWATLRYR